MKLKHLISFLEELAPPVYQESYDNSGLIVGDKDAKIKGVMCCLDSVEEVLEEAIEKKCNVIVAHHPIVFKGLKSITGKNYVERVILKAIKNDIAIYAIHTNLDNVYAQGVNAKIAARLALQNTSVLSAKAIHKKLNLYLPTHNSESLRKQLSELGTMIGTGFSTIGVQTGNQASIKMELHFPIHLESAILKILSREEDVHYEISTIQNTSGQIGSGMIGTLEEEMSEQHFLAYLKEQMQVEVIRHTRLLGKKIRKVAVCGGAGGFLLSHAIRQKADVFITADYKYHEFFDADQRIIIADIGHYESEQFTIELLQELISRKFTTFAAFSTTIRTNPVFYYLQ